MPTIDSKPIIKKIIENNGVYEDDPQVLAVHQYLNSWGNITWHLSYHQGHHDSLLESPFCRDLVTLWTRKGITSAGKEFLCQSSE